MKILSIFCLFMSLALTGCVGTVEETAEGFTKASDAADSPLRFAGINSASAISDTRVEVFFYPASGGSGKYTYDIQVGSSPYPISIPYDVLTPDYRGLLKATITGLTRLSTYQIKVEVRDGESQVQSNSGIMKTVSTFNHVVADFNGISSAFNTPGQGGKDSIKIRWTPAKSQASSPKPDWQPKSYEVVLVNADLLTPKDMDVNLSPGQGRWVFSFNYTDSTNEYIIRGLPAKTKFYIRMRALHEKSQNDAYDPTKRSELNTNYVTISTLSDALADINFLPDSFGLALTSGENGLSSVQASWTEGAGVFDHYRLYYGLQGSISGGVLPDLCLSPATSPPGATIFCKKVAYDMKSTPITGLTAYTAYEVKLVLCTTSACNSNGQQIVSPTRSITTDPTSPVFGGVEAVTSAQSLSEVGNLYIEFEIPSFTTGFFDGLILEMRRTQDGSDVPIEITQISNPIYHIDYNFLTQNKLVVKGVNYLDPAPYCFHLYPFKWASDLVTKRLEKNDVWKCIQPTPEGPTVAQFSGLLTAKTEKDIVTLTWGTPTGGLFSHYELFWTKQAGDLSFGNAIPEIDAFNFTNYGRVLVDSSLNEISLPGFGNGQYTFGMITYYNYVTDTGSVIKRSETNGAKKQCTVNIVSTNTVDCPNY